MQLYPAIDLRGGQCVRLMQGNFNRVTVYSDRPEEIAKLWASQGATFLHLVDLDGALAGHSVNEEAIRNITDQVSIPVQIGGGIRTEEDIAYMLSLGVKRVVIGTKAVEEPEFVKEMVQKFGPECIVVGIDSKQGMVAVEGWKKLSSISALDLSLQMKEYGIRHIVYTDISRDGMMTGPNIPAIRNLTEYTGLDIIASGGVSSIDDLRQLRKYGVRGAIIGKALYEKKIDLKSAVIELQVNESQETGNYTEGGSFI